jgi:hypothetical protein
MKNFISWVDWITLIFKFLNKLKSIWIRRWTTQSSRPCNRTCTRTYWSKRPLHALTCLTTEMKSRTLWWNEVGLSSPTAADRTKIWILLRSKVEVWILVTSAKGWKTPYRILIKTRIQLGTRMKRVTPWMWASPMLLTLANKPTKSLREKRGKTLKISKVFSWIQIWWLTVKFQRLIKSSPQGWQSLRWRKGMGFLRSLFLL